MQQQRTVMQHYRIFCRLMAAAWMSCIAVSAYGRTEVVAPADSIRTTDIEEIVVVSTPKEDARLRQQPLSSTSFAHEQMLERGIDGVTGLTANVPNLFIPDYGSRLTTSVYIRGIGSRTGTPAVALYVDGVPQLSPAGFDFNFSGVDRIDVLRGPQTTLYGRNSMGGVIRVYTKNPFHYQGTDITLRGAGILHDGSDVSGALQLTHYHRVSNRFAFSVNLFCEADGGYFTNEARDGERIDTQQDCGGRMRFVIKPSENLNIDLTASHEWLRQGGYPYEYRGVVGNPSTPDPVHDVGTIAYDNRSGYRRNLTNAGLTIDRRWKRATLTSVTGFQHLHDNMKLDQDFTDRNLYTLLQRQNANTLSEELILKGSIGIGHAATPTTYSWLLGATAMRQWLNTYGPVTFHSDGLEWLNGLINHQASSHMPTVKGEEYTMNFMFNNNIYGTELDFPGSYDTPTSNLALFHQSTFNNLFGINGLNLTAGLRLDREHMRLAYDAYYYFHQTYSLGGRLTYPDGSTRDGMTLVPESEFDVADQIEGDIDRSYVKLLPKVTLQWAPIRSTADARLSALNIYATVSQGYRSGGYNVQMFSDILQGRMQTCILQNVTAVTLPVVRQQPSMPDVAKATVEQILTTMSAEKDYDIDALTWYQPETSWNYEVGAHLTAFDARLQADLAAFWMDTRDQQLSLMTSGGLGRVTVNSGRSRSVGAEVSMRARPTDGLDIQMAYGYTDARFREEAETYVPFVPRHTLSVGATQTWTLGVGRTCFLRSIALHADYRAAGRVYWTTDNDVSQPFAGVLNARLTFVPRLPAWERRMNGGVNPLSVAIYAENILSTRYQTFYFETMQRSFAQYCRPMSFGVEARMQF